MDLILQGISKRPTISLERQGRLVTLTLDRPEAHNAIDHTMLQAIHSVLDALEADSTIRSLVIAGQAGTFCTGLDFNATDGVIEESARLYFQLLRRLTTMPVLCIARVDGRVNAGGIGLVAAADYVLASPLSTFRLTEVLIGMIPANVLPFLIRRTGVHKAYLLALTAELLEAERACTFGLVDEVSSDLDTAQRRLLLRSGNIPAASQAALKHYLNRICPLGKDVEDLAVEQVSLLLRDPASANRVRELMHHGLWQAGS